MKKIITYILILFILIMISACGNNKIIEGKEYKTIGLVNIWVNDESMLDIKDPKIQYKIIWGNVIWGALLFETVISPIYFFGFSMFEPVEKKLVGK